MARIIRSAAAARRIALSHGLGVRAEGVIPTGCESERPGRGTLPPPMRITKLCTLFVRLTAPAPMGLGIQGQRDLCIVIAFAGTALASLVP